MDEGVVGGVCHIIDRPLHKCSLLAPSNGLIMHYGGVARPVVAVLIVLIGTPGPTIHQGSISSHAHQWLVTKHLTGGLVQGGVGWWREGERGCGWAGPQKKKPKPRYSHPTNSGGKESLSLTTK